MERDFTLTHHGILGQKWGKRNGPPYPIDAQDHSASEKKAGWKKSIDKSSNEDLSDKKKGLSDKQKQTAKRIAIGAAVVAGTCLAAYGGYRMYKSGNLNPIIDKFKKIGENGVGEYLAGNAEFVKLSVKESIEDSISKANPLKGTVEGSNNCVPSAIASFMRQAGYDVTARSTNGKMQNTAGVIEECFKGAKVLEGSATKFGQSKADASDMLLKRFGKDAEGVCAIDWTTGGGHCFSWKIERGKVMFYDGQNGFGDENVSKYWKRIKRDGQLVLARLDNLEIDIEAVSKYVK